MYKITLILMVLIMSGCSHVHTEKWCEDWKAIGHCIYAARSQGEMNACSKHSKDFCGTKIEWWWQ